MNENQLVNLIQKSKKPQTIQCSTDLFERITLTVVNKGSEGYEFIVTKQKAPDNPVDYGHTNPEDRKIVHDLEVGVSEFISRFNLSEVDYTNYDANIADESDDEEEAPKRRRGRAKKEEAPEGDGGNTEGDTDDTQTDS